MTSTKIYKLVDIPQNNIYCDSQNKIKSIDVELELLDKKRDSFSSDDIKNRAKLLDQKDELNNQFHSINNKEMISG